MQRPLSAGAKVRRNVSHVAETVSSRADDHRLQSLQSGLDGMQARCGLELCVNRSLDDCRGVELRPFIWGAKDASCAAASLLTGRLSLKSGTRRLMRVVARKAGSPGQNAAPTRDRSTPRRS